MKKRLRVFCPRILVLALVVFGLPAAAQPEAGRQPSTFKSPLEISIEALIGTPSQPASGNAAAAPAENGAPGDENVEPQDTVGTRTLSDLIEAFDLIGARIEAFTSQFGALTETSAWLDRQSQDPRYAAYWIAIGDDLVYIVGIPFAAAAFLELLLYPARQNLRRRKPAAFAGRLLIGLGMLGLRFFPVMLFVSMSLTHLDRNQDAHVVRFVVLNIVYALAVSRVVVMTSRFMFAPRNAALRLMPATAAQAKYTHRWICAYVAVIAFGYFFIDAANAVHIPPGAIAAFGNMFGFILLAMTTVVIMQKRDYISMRLRGDIVASRRDLSLLQSVRLWFARRWHILAILYLVVGFLITISGVRNGLALMLRGTILTLTILILMRALFHAVNRWGVTEADGEFHHAALRALFRLVIWGAAIVAAAAGWGADIPALFATPFGQRVMNAGFSVGATVVSVTLAYEIFSVMIERHLNRRGEDGETLRVSARARTLLPMIRNTAFIIFAMIVALVTLSAAGVNIAPLLAGAGVIGVAIGFGSQTLVKDFMTGLFIILENVIAVGDFVKIGDFTGVIETLSVRTIRLRDENGALHVLPFSEVTRITNLSRDFSYALIDVGVACDSDLDHVMQVIRAVGSELQEDPVSGRLIMEPVEVLGVENLGDFSITIRSRIRTRPAMQREVRRMFLLRLKQRFDKEGIEIPFPTVTYIRQQIPEPASGGDFSR